MSKPFSNLKLLITRLINVISSGVFSSLSVTLSLSLSLRHISHTGRFVNKIFWTNEMEKFNTEFLILFVCIIKTVFLFRLKFECSISFRRLARHGIKTFDSSELMCIEKTRKHFWNTNRPHKTRCHEYIISVSFWDAEKSLFPVASRRLLSILNLLVCKINRHEFRRRPKTVL